MGVREIDRSLEQWEMGVKDIQRRVILAPTPRERERWYAILLLAQGWTAAATAEMLERDPHTIGRWGVGLWRRRPQSIDFRADWGFPPALEPAQQEELKEAVQQLPTTWGMELANWTLRQAQEEGGGAVCVGTIRYQHQPQRLPEVAAPAGIRLQEAEEAVAEGG